MRKSVSSNSNIPVTEKAQIWRVRELVVAACRRHSSRLQLSCRLLTTAYL